MGRTKNLKQLLEFQNNLVNCQFYFLVDSDGVHVNKKDGSTWINCDSECPIPSLVCRTPGSRCNEDGIMQVCDEMLKGVHFATWCVNEVNGKSIHKNCPEICEEGAVVKVLHQIDSGR